jgi:hypothetical protein
MRQPTLQLIQKSLYFLHFHFRMNDGLGKSTAK